MAITYSELRMPTLDFAGKTAIVTGAGRGIGCAIALTLAHYGANVVCSSRSKEQCDETVGIIKSHGGSALTVTADVSSRADAENLIAKALEEYGKVDILVNNAGYSGTPTPFEELPDEQHQRVFRRLLQDVIRIQILIPCRDALEDDDGYRHGLQLRQDNAPEGTQDTCAVDRRGFIQRDGNGVDKVCV